MTRGRRTIGQHHGDLRRALLDAAWRRLAHGEELSLRGVAQDVGVSSGAPYHHFGSKEGLTAAVAADAFADLAADLDAAVVGVAGEDVHDDAAARLAAMAGRYVAFGLRHPERYRMMWGPSLDSGDFPELEARALACFDHLRRAVAAVRGGGVADEAGAAEAAALGWALAHGVILLQLEGAFEALPLAGEGVVAAVGAAVVAVARRP